MPFGATTYDSPYLKALEGRSPLIIGGSSSSGTVPDPLELTSDITARTGAATQTKIGALGPSSEAAISFGDTTPTTMYLQADGALWVDNSFYCEGYLAVNEGAGGGWAVLYVGAQGNAGAPRWMRGWDPAADRIYDGFEVAPTGAKTYQLLMAGISSSATHTFFSDGGFTVTGDAYVGGGLSVAGGSIAVDAQGGTAVTAGAISDYPNYSTVAGPNGSINFPSSYSDGVDIYNNLRWDNPNARYDLLSAGYGAQLSVIQGRLQFWNAPTGAAGDHPTLTKWFEIDNAGSATFVGTVRAEDIFVADGTLVVNEADGAPSGAGNCIMFGSGWSSRIYANVGGTTYLSIDKSPPAADNTTKIATTAWVLANAGGGGSGSGRGYIYADDYADLATAVAAASAGECVFLTPGATYTISGSTLILPAGVSLFSPCPYRGAYGAGGALVTGSVSPLIQFDNTATFAGKQTVEGITFQSTASGTTAVIFDYNFNGYGISWQRFYDCMFDMASATATNRVAIRYTWSASGTVEQVYYEHCGFQSCDTAIGGSDSTYTSDWDKCVVEKCRFDSCRGTATWPAQIYFYISYMRTGAIRDCVFEGATDNARAGIYLGAQFQTFTIDNCYMEGMASAAASTYDEVIVDDPPGAVTPGTCLIVSGTRLGDRGTSSNAVRYSLNLENLGGAFLDSSLTASAFITASNMGVIRMSRYGGYSGSPSSSVEIHCTSATTS